MKKLLFFLVILTCYPAWSQIVLEKTISNGTENSSFWSISFSKLGNKFVENNLGWGNDTILIKIYESNYSILRNIVIEEKKLNLEEVTFKEVMYISDNLFNLDDKVEFLCQIYYREAEGEIWKGVVVLNEDAQILHKIKNGNITSKWSYNSKKMEYVQKIDESYKLIIPIKSHSGNETEIYSLPGVLPETPKLLETMDLYPAITATE